MNLPIDKQSDDRWKNKPMGTSGLTLGGFGCLETCVAMLLANYSINETPGTLGDKLNAINGYDGNGSLEFYPVESLFKDLCFYGRFYTQLDPSPSHVKQTQADALDRIYRMVSLGFPIAVNVESGRTDLPNHFVLIRDYLNGDKTQPIINDPGYGETAPFKQRYGDPMKNIFGYVVFVGPATSYPVWGDKRGVDIWKIARAKKLFGIDPTNPEIRTQVSESLDAFLSS